MRYLKQILMLIVSIVVLNVWLLRNHKATIYRGGNATNLYEEFMVYGFDESFLYLIGILKVTAALGLLLGLIYKKFVIPCAFLIASLMLGAVVMHFKVSDEIHKFIPAGLMLLCSVSIIWISKSEAKLLS